MEKNLISILEEVSKKVDKHYSGGQKAKYQKDLQNLIGEYKKVDVQEKHEETYESLAKRGKELLNQTNIKDNKKLEYYLRYCNAALYDFQENIQPLNILLKAYLITCTLFFVLSPQYFSFVLPLIFVLPIFLGLRGMKRRVLNGLMLGVSVIPMAVLVSIIWLKNAVLTMGNFGQFVSNLAQQYKFSYAFTQNLVIACIALSAIMLVSSFTTLYYAIKYRKMFI